MADEQNVPKLFTELGTREWVENFKCHARRGLSEPELDAVVRTCLALTILLPRGQNANLDIVRALGDHVIDPPAHPSETFIHPVFGEGGHPGDTLNRSCWACGAHWTLARIVRFPIPPDEVVHICSECLHALDRDKLDRHTVEKLAANRKLLTLFVLFPVAAAKFIAGETE